MSAKLLHHAQRIWQAGVDSVRGHVLVSQHLGCNGKSVTVDTRTFPLPPGGRCFVIGAGKAAGSMARGVEMSLGLPWLRSHLAASWVNVPDDCLNQTAVIHLHAGRPASCNEPTEAAIAGTEQILRIVRQASDNDLALFLLSGGASALLVSPIPEISLQDKIDLTRVLSAAGADIRELNTVRKHLSRVKGGRLAAACRARSLVTLVLSDVLGDPLEIIGSGPTWPDASLASDALAIVRKYGVQQQLPRVAEALCAASQGASAAVPLPGSVEHFILGNLSVALDHAAAAARHLGYTTECLPVPTSEGDVEHVAQYLADKLRALRISREPACIVSGGEPTLPLISSDLRGRGGRNQQLVLSVLDRLWPRDRLDPPADVEGVGHWAFLSGGTDGEDGPTDAAGALCDERSWTSARDRGLDPADFLRRNDAYSFFAKLGTLLRTGPTQTNVCDVRVLLHEP